MFWTTVSIGLTIGLAPPQYIPHFVFEQVDNEEALRTYAGFTLEQFETFKVGENIEDIILIQDEIEITKNG